MKAKYFFLAVAASAMLSACSNDEGESPKFDGIIRLTTSSIDMNTRAEQSIQGTLFDAGESVDIFLKDALDDGSGTPGSDYTVYPQPLVTTTTKETAKNNLNFATTQIWPINNHSLNIWAVYPSGSAGTSDVDVTTTSIPFTVQTDQSTTVAYKASDLMTGVAANPVAPSENTMEIPLVFTHLLSKVNVNLSKTAATTTITDEQLATAKVYIMNTKPTTTFAPQTTEVTVASGDATEIFVGEGIASSAILVPQTVAGGKEYIKVVIGDDTFIYSIPTGGITLEAKKVHTYDIKIHKASIILTATITDWESAGENVNGTGYIQ
jgi:hypothetical protein